MAGIEASKIVDSIDDTVSALNGVTKACGNLKEAIDLPDAFHAVVKRVPLVTDTLEKAEGHLRTHDPNDKSRKAMWPDVESCMKKAENLKTVFRQVAPPGGTPRPERYRLAVSSLGKGSRVETLMKNILENVHRLVGECETEKDGQTIKAVDEARVQELVEAINEMAKIPPSLPEGAPGSSVNNYGSGTVNANTGDGTQNNNTSSGRQYIGERQYFGRDE